MIPSLVFHNGHKIPQLGLGTSKIVGESADAVIEAIKIGYRHFDDASCYDNEKVIGDALRQSGVPREELYITSKVRPQDMNRESALKSVEKTLTDFGIDYVDLLLIHWPYAEGVDRNDGAKLSQLRKQVWETFIQLKKQGKAKDIGVSSFQAKHLQPLLQTEEKPVVNQLRLNPYSIPDEVQFCAKHGILIEAYSPLQECQYGILEDPVLNEISQRYKKTVAQVCLRWIVQLGHILIPKSATASRIRQNFEIYDFQLSEEDVAKINELHKLGKVPPLERMICE